MPELEYRTRRDDLTDADLRPLYESVGWRAYTRRLDDLAVLLQQCCFVESAWAGNRLVGLIRAVGDGVSITYAQDLLVAPDFQGRGIGRRLLADLLAATTAIPQFVLITDSSEGNARAREWYRHQGLTAMPEAGIAGYYLERWPKPAAKNRKERP